MSAQTLGTGIRMKSRTDNALSPSAKDQRTLSMLSWRVKGSDRGTLNKYPHIRKNRDGYMGDYRRAQVG